MFNTGGGDLKNWGREVNYFGSRRGGGNFFQTLKGGLNFFHASLANIFNKCYKKAVFMIKQLNLDKNKIWAWGGDWNLLMHSKGGRFHACEWGCIFLRCQPNFHDSPSPTPVLNGCSLNQMVNQCLFTFFWSAGWKKFLFKCGSILIYFDDALSIKVLRSHIIFFVTLGF